MQVLRRLCADPHNQVVIISGRDRHFLDRYFAKLPLALTAEHGYLVRDKVGVWRETKTQPPHWKPIIRRELDEAARDLPGVKLEEKASSLVWHFDGATDEAACAVVAADLRERLRPQLDQLGLVAESGRKILEVRIAGVTKGHIARRWLDAAPWDFVLAAGDDTTDETMFAELPPGAFSIKVRPGATAARYHLADAAAMLVLLEGLTASAPTP